MARTGATMSDRIVDHFQTVELRVAEEDLRVAKRIVQNRVAVRDEKAGANKPKPKPKVKPKAKVTPAPGTGTGLASMSATVNK